MKRNICRVGNLFQIIIFGAFLGNCSQARTTQGNLPEGRKQAQALIQPKGDSQLIGRTVFGEVRGRVTLRVMVENAPPGPHAVHIHEIGDCSSPDGKSAGGHWNPTGVDHGKWGTEPFHLGDIGNIEVDPDGRGTLSLRTDFWSIGGPEGTNVVGRAIIVHSGADDFVSQPTGNAGSRIGCGVIQEKD